MLRNKGRAKNTDFVVLPKSHPIYEESMFELGERITIKAIFNNKSYTRVITCRCDWIRLPCFQVLITKVHVVHKNTIYRNLLLTIALSNLNQSE